MSPTTGHEVDIAATLTTMGVTYDPTCAMVHLGPCGSGKTLQVYWIRRAIDLGTYDTVINQLPHYAGTCPTQITPDDIRYLPRS